MKKQQRRLEIQSIRSFKQNIQEVEDRIQKKQEFEDSKARQGQKDFKQRERDALARRKDDRVTADEQIVSQLYAVEVKLKVGQQRAKNWQDQNRKGKAEHFN